MKKLIISKTGIIVNISKSICRDFFNLIGARRRKACGPFATYFASLDICVPLDVSNTKDFIDAIQVENICLGDRVDSLFKLEQLRFCSSIITALEISLNDPDADYTALRDIRVLFG